MVANGGENRGYVRCGLEWHCRFHVGSVMNVVYALNSISHFSKICKCGDIAFGWLILLSFLNTTYLLHTMKIINKMIMPDPMSSPLVSPSFVQKYHT